MGTNSGKQTVKDLMAMMDEELTLTYNELVASSSREDLPENDYSVITRLSITVSMLSILLVKIENMLETDGLNYMSYQPKLMSLKELISSLKASMYARSAKVRAKTAEIYERNESKAEEGV